jgi:hypothetical protein
LTIGQIATAVEWELPFPFATQAGVTDSGTMMCSACGGATEELGMKRCLFFAIPLAAWAVAVSGCGGTPGYYPVYGKVLYKGEPAVGATVYFHREGGGDPIPMGVVEADGSFQLSSDAGYGAPPGQYRVLIEWRAKSPSQGVVTTVSHTREVRVGQAVARAPRKSRFSRTQPDDRLGGRYFRIEQPLLKAELKPESNTLAPFDLND